MIESVLYMCVHMRVLLYNVKSIIIILLIMCINNNIVTLLLSAGLFQLSPFSLIYV